MNKRIIIVVAAVVLILAVCIGLIAHYARSEQEPPLTAAELLDLGEKYLHELNYEQAIVQFTAIIQIEPMNIRAYLGGADAYLHMEKQQEAMDLLATGVDATDNDNLAHALGGVEKSVLEGYIAIAEAYEAEGFHDKAMEILQRLYDETGDEIIGRKLGIVEASNIAFREDYVIAWKDAAFERLIREYLGKPTGDIHYDDVKLIEEIEIWGEEIEKEGESFRLSYWENGFTLNDVDYARTGKIKTLADLEHFSSLIRLTITYQEALDISLLANTGSIDCLKRLERLHLMGNLISDISVVSNLIALQALGLSFNNVSDISPISMLIELTSINIGNNENIVSMEPLRGLRNLSSISIDSADLSIFTTLTELKHLQIFGADDWSVLAKLQTIESLEIAATDENFPYIVQLNALSNLRLHGNGSIRRNNPDAERQKLTSINGIGSLVNLEQLDLLAHDCHDISPLAGSNVSQLEIELPDDCDLTPLTKMPNLEKVVVPGRYQGEPGQEEQIPMIDRVKALLPHIEVASDWY